MAPSKAQVNARYNGQRYRERGNPSVRPVQSANFGGVPASVVDWYPEQNHAVNFMSKLMGTADTVASLANTEAARQYEEAQARAMRGDFTIDDSHLITFTGAQRKALSEVEGSLAGDEATNDLVTYGKELQQRLSERTDLTAAQRITEFDREMRQRAYGSLSAGMDTDFLKAKGGKVHNAAGKLIDSYRSAVIQGELANEREKVATAFRNDLGNLDTDTALQNLSRRWTSVTGAPISTASDSVLRPFVAELVSRGERAELERLKEMELTPGVTFEGLGLITDRTLSQADDQFTSNFRRAEVERERIGIAAAREHTGVFSEFDQRLMEIGKLTGDAQTERVAEVNAAIQERLEAINQDTRLDETQKEPMRNRLRAMAFKSANGGWGDPQLSASASRMLEEWVAEGRTDQVLAYIQSHPELDYSPRLQSYTAAAWSYDAQEKKQLKQQELWMSGVLEQSTLPTSPLGDAAETREMQRAARERLWVLYERNRQADPEGTPDGWQLAAEEAFHKQYPKRTAEEQMNFEAQQKTLEVLKSGDVTEVSRLLEAPESLQKLAPADRQRLMKAIDDSPNYTDTGKRGMKLLLNRPELAAAAVDYREPTRGFLPFAFQPKYTGNFTDKVADRSACGVLVRGEDGTVNFSFANGVATLDQRNILTPPVDANAVWFDGKRLRSVTDVQTEAEAEQMAAMRRPEQLPGGTLSNPKAHRLDLWQSEYFTPNLSNQDKTMEDHVVVIRAKASFGATTSELHRVSIKQLASGGYDKYDILTKPFDPDLHVLRNGRLLRLGDFSTDELVKCNYDPTPVEFMSFTELNTKLNRWTPFGSAPEMAKVK